MSRLWLCTLLIAALAGPCGAAEIAFLYSTYQDKQFAYMPGEYSGQYNGAGAQIKAAGFAWDRVDSEAVEAGVLTERGYKVLILSYTSVMSPQEAAAIADFVKQGGRIFAVYASLNTPWTANGPGEPGKGLLAQTMGMESAATVPGARYMRAEKADHPLLSLLPLYVFNPHGHAVRMKPLPGTAVIASWAADEQTATDPASGALLVSPTTVYFSGFLWRLPEAPIIIANALNFLLGRPAQAATVLWEPVRQAAPVTDGLNLPHSSTPAQDVDAVGWEISQLQDGLATPTCAVVAPVTAPDVYQHARRLAQALSCPLVSDRAAMRDGLGRHYDLIAVGRLFADRCENPLGNTLLGVRDVLKQYAGQPHKAVIRAAPAEATRGGKRLLLVAGTDMEGLTRAEELIRASVHLNRAAEGGKVAVWQPESVLGDLVYPWTPRPPGLLSELALPSAVNQIARTRFVVTASTGFAPVEVSLQLSPLSGAAGVFPADRIKLLLTRYVRSNITKIEEPHPLVPGTHFSLEPAAQQEVWLTADCTGATPGTYAGNLVLQGPSGPLHNLKVTLDVSPIRLAPANRHQKLTCVWDYAISGHMHGNLLSLQPGQQLTPERKTRAQWNEYYEQHFRDHWRAYVDDLEAHGVNVMFISATMGLPQYQVNGQQIDAARLGPLVSYARQHGFRLFIFTQVLGQGCYYPDSDVIAGPENPIFSPGWDAAYCKVLEAYADFMRAQGLTYKEWAIYPFDEPHNANNANLINHVAGLIGRTDPQIQIWADPMRPEDKNLSTVDFWKSMEKSVAIWWPGDGYLPVGSEPLKYLQASGKPFGFYRCAAYSTKSRPAVRPDGYYRAFGWQVARLGASGMGFWTWLAWLGDSWNDEDAQSRDGDGAVVYEGPAGPITTNDWECWGAGVDDYKYLEAMDAAIVARAKRLGKADALCDEAIRLRG
ncbi:MAG: hypothetical protein ABFE07_00015, partial [Armatimonadia bacterium]